MDVCCRCGTIITTSADLDGAASLAPFLCQALDVLLAQLHEVPKDFFDSALSCDNFLGVCLRALVANTKAGGRGVDAKVKRAVQKIRLHCLKVFAWDLERAALADDEDEDAPVIVDTSVGYAL